MGDASHQGMKLRAGDRAPRVGAPVDPFACPAGGSTALRSSEKARAKAFDLTSAIESAQAVGGAFGRDVHTGYSAALYITLGRRPSPDEVVQAMRFSAANAAKAIGEEVRVMGGSERQVDDVRAAYLEAVDVGLIHAEAARQVAEVAARNEARTIDLSRLSKTQFGQLQAIIRVLGAPSSGQSA